VASRRVYPGGVSAETNGIDPSAHWQNPHRRYFPTLAAKTPAPPGRWGSPWASVHADFSGWLGFCHPGGFHMSELANTDSLRKLDERHEELLGKLEELCLELDTALKNLMPKAEADSLQDAA
jgi:hypothetical protein